jgi:nodulation protein E
VSRRRVVITGLGGLCAIGSDADSIWHSMCDGRCGLGPLTIDRRDLKTNVGGEISAIEDIVEGSGIDPRRLATMGRFSVLAVLSAGEALAASGLDLNATDQARIGAAIGVAVWGADAVDEGYRDIFLEGKKRTNIFTVPRAMPSAPAGQVSMQYGFTAIWRFEILGIASRSGAASLPALLRRSRRAGFGRRGRHGRA